MVKIQNTTARRRGRFARIVRWCFALAVCCWFCCALALVALRWVRPPFTAVQVERWAQARIHHRIYQRQYSFAPLERIAPEFQHAVVAAEDARFYQHHGFDWHEIQNALDEEDDRRVRGASTISQQLVKNLFFGMGWPPRVRQPVKTLVTVRG